MNKTVMKNLMLAVAFLWPGCLLAVEKPSRDMIKDFCIDSEAPDLEETDVIEIARYIGIPGDKEQIAGLLRVHLTGKLAVMRAQNENSYNAVIGGLTGAGSARKEVPNYFNACSREFRKYVAQEYLPPEELARKRAADEKERRARKEAEIRAAQEERERREEESREREAQVKKARQEKREREEREEKQRLALEEAKLQGLRKEEEMRARIRAKVEAEIREEIRREQEVKQKAREEDYKPIVKVAPQYPRRALSRGLTGWVILEYTVTAEGSVKDARVVENCAHVPGNYSMPCSNSPNKVFDKSALKAAEKFKYKPRVVDGIPVENRGVQNKIDYELAPG